jgi:tetratricopeptide (TPR) repeat protein
LSANRKQRRIQNRQNQKTGGFSPVQGLFDQALQHHKAGQFTEAEQFYRKVLSIDPQHADSLHLLGVIAHQVGRLDIAAALIGNAITAREGVPAFHNNLGNVLKDQGRHTEAEAQYRRALSLKPNYAEALNNLGVTLQLLGSLEDAANSCRQAIALKPDYAEAHFNLGNILEGQGNANEANACFQKSLALKPDADTHVNIGHLLQSLHEVEEAATHYKAALALKPDSLEALNNLGNILADQRKFKEAIDYYRQAITFKPDSAEAHFNLGQLLQHGDQFDEAIMCYERALALKPDSLEALQDMGNILVAQSRLDEAIACYQRILTLNPASEKIYNNLLLAMIYAASVSPEELAATARAFGECIANPLLRTRPLLRDKDPERRLRIGYVSPDLREHAVNYFLGPLAKLHDRKQFEFFAYSNNQRDDANTVRRADDRRIGRAQGSHDHEPLRALGRRRAARRGRRGGKPNRRADG